MTQEEKELYNAANAYAFDLDCGDLNTNRDTFVAGAKWQKEQIIEKACEWLLKNDSYAKPTEVLVRDFRKAMEE